MMPAASEEVTFDPRERLLWALRRTALAVDAVKAKRLRDVSLGGPDYSVLACVRSEPGLSGAELSRRLGVTPQAVVPLVRRLAQEGLIERRPHPRHLHVQELHITSAGRTSLQAADRVVNGIEGQLRDHLGTSDHAQLRRLLDAVADYLVSAEVG